VLENKPVDNFRAGSVGDHRDFFGRMLIFQLGDGGDLLRSGGGRGLHQIFALDTQIVSMIGGHQN
jgi:hypothetical protein